MEGETPEVTEEPVRGGLQTVVVVTDETEDEETPMDDRLIRRRTRRRSILDEVDETTGLEELTMGGQGERADTEERRLAAERKRKGKQEVQNPPNKSKKATTEPTDKLMSDAIKVPFAPGMEDQADDSEWEEDKPEQEEEPNFVRTEVWVTKKLLESMEKFDDPKRIQTHKERSVSGKLVKSGKRYDPESLREIESEEEFLSYIKDIGFEWLLNHSDHEVPVVVAREFFSTFKFKSAVDEDADSISFRLFNTEHVMSIREWSLRLGLFTNEEDAEGVWNERMIGPPKNTPGFKPQAAWKMITYKKSGVFKTSVYKGFHISNHLIRFAQVFIGYNFMGTASSALTTPELYFVWCMAKKVKVHLGFWLAQACHLMTSNLARHLYTCHLLGAYIQRNIVMKIAKVVPVVPMCEALELFSLEYFFNKNLLYMDGEEVCFYEIGKVEATVKKEVEGVEAPATMEGEVLMKELTKVRKEMKAVKLEVQMLREEITDLAGKSSLQNERMTEAVQIMMRMADWL